MRKIIAATFITLDGVVEAPGRGDTTLPEQRGWSEAFMTPEVGQMVFAQMSQSDAMLLGRQTYQDFAAYWPSVAADDPFGQYMNGQTKYVVSNTLPAATWTNTTLIQGDVASKITALKQQPGKNINMTGSGTLIRSLMQHDLIDEYQFLLCPIVLGVGKRLFADGGITKILRLVNSQAFSSGMMLLTYQPASRA